MPEYLAPGVYVEEVDTGSKPIEGVSTSTTGMLGVTERGPVDVPILVTSYGEYARWFGERLNPTAFSNGDRAHWYLPHAVEGYFTNGGKRAYITRVLPDDASAAVRTLHDRGATGTAASLLLRSAPQDTGSTALSPALYALDVSNLTANDWVRIGNGSRAEYRQVDSIGTTALHVSLNTPLDFAHDPGVTVDEIARTIDTAYTGAGTGIFSLVEDVAAGTESILVDVPDANDQTVLSGLFPGGTQLIEVGTSPASEHLYVTDIEDLGSNQYRLHLQTALRLDHASADLVTALEIPAPSTAAILDMASNAGDLLIYLDDLGGAFTTTTNLVVIDAAGQPEVRRIGSLDRLTLDLGTYEDYPPATVIELVEMADDDREAQTGSTATDLILDSIEGLAVGMTLTVNTEPRIVSTIDEASNTVSLQTALSAAPTAGDIVHVTAKALTADVAEGRITLSLDDRLGLEVGDVLRIGVAPDEEYATVASVSGERGVAPDAGNVVLSQPVRQTHVNGTEVRRQDPPAIDTSRQRAFLVLEATEGATNASGATPSLVVNDGTTFVRDEIVMVSLPSGSIYYHRLSAASITLSPREVVLTEALESSHELGMPLVEREPLVQVAALDPGTWGNRLLVSVEDEATGLVSRAQLSHISTPTQIRLTTVTGVEPGTVLELLDVETGERIGDPVKVRLVDRSSNNLITLDNPGLSAAQIGAHNAAQAVDQSLPIRSREFRITVHLRRQPDPAVPSRNETIVDSEVFQHLSMDPRHSRYIHSIIGTTWTAGNTDDDDGNALRLEDRRSQGESNYIRVRDLTATQAEAESVRLGPETLIDILPSGQERAARHALDGGDDSIATLIDQTYIGDDDVEPVNRTGLQSFKNIEQISLVACPGQTTSAIQQALIDHCEEMRYRFAVLDAAGPPTDSLNDVQNQRQQFDSKYASLYHPWLLIPDPMPASLADPGQATIPPSGHMLGIYARTDMNRGVHKAPANEVVGGITGLQRSLNKGEHDILNPSPVNINVIRDFRPNNRGIRVWGARVITSDSDFKYVNVRRLLIFLEHSIERGLQWVVFEPNAEPLWARVRRSISNFLTVVWRNGALEGTAVEEAFFVKCDRTTMTQTDIDNGRLICVIGVAPVKPAEFVIIRIGLWTAHAQD